MKNLVGQKFGLLTAVKPIGKDKFGHYKWLCKCECGNETEVLGTSLLRGYTTSCKCIRNTTHITHGLTNTRLYSIWKNMKKRCFYTKDKKYPIYGGRGITVCDEWLGDVGFLNFYNWAVNNGYSDELTLDRKDVNGNYEVSNCRWATLKEQANNTRKSIEKRLKHA